MALCEPGQTAPEHVLLADSHSVDGFSLEPTHTMHMASNGLSNACSSGARVPAAAYDADHDCAALTKGTCSPYNPNTAAHGINAHAKLAV